MRRAMSRRGWALFAGAAAVLAALATTGSTAEQARPELRGACCCRAQRDLMCTANLTERECDRAVEARPLRRVVLARSASRCWNWGYGG